MAWPQPLRAGVTVLGNLAIDRVDDAGPSPGGCASFASQALDAIGGLGRVVARAAPQDLPLFAAVLGASNAPVDVLTADTTSGFGLRYHGDGRQMTVDAIGPVWGPAEIALAAPRTTWVHVSPLLRTDFRPDALAALAAAGHWIAYDGQGLVRAARVGPLLTDASYDPALLVHLSVLKLADDEAAALAGGAFGPAHAAALGVPEILVTAGSAGCMLYLPGETHHVPSAWKVRGVHPTGAGDLFTVAYVGARASGDQPLKAVHVASQLVAEMLQVRLESSGLD